MGGRAGDWAGGGWGLSGGCSRLGCGLCRGSSRLSRRAWLCRSRCGPLGGHTCLSRQGKLLAHRAASRGIDRADRDDAGSGSPYRIGSQRQTPRLLAKLDPGLIDAHQAMLDLVDEVVDQGLAILALLKPFPGELHVLLAADLVENEVEDVLLEPEQQ